MDAMRLIENNGYDFAEMDMLIWENKQRPSFNRLAVECAHYGNIDCFLKLVKHKVKTKVYGYVGRSPVEKNHILTNPLGAAVMQNNFIMLKNLIPSMKDIINTPVVEYGPDKFDPEGSLKNKEYTGYTPLILAIISERCSFDTFKYLATQGANVFATDWQGNNIL